MKFEEYEITSSAVDDYIKYCLSNGTAFMKKVLTIRDIPTAVKYTFWKRDFPLDKINCFKNTLYKEQLDDTLRWVTEKINQFINSEKMSLVIFEESIIDSSDSYLTDQNVPPYFTSEIDIYEGKEVYYFVDNSIGSQDDIEIALANSGSAGPFSSTALIKLPENIRIEKGMQVSEKMLDILAANVEHLIFGVFDLDGYIICSFGEKL